MTSNSSIDDEFLSAIDEEQSIDKDEIEDAVENSDDGLFTQFMSWLTSDNTDTMNEKFEFLVNERGYDKENLPPEGSDCLEKLHTNEQKVAELEDEEQSTNVEPNNTEQLDQVSEQLDQMQESMVDEDDIVEVVDERLAANEEREEKRELAEVIVANSDDHDDVDELAENNDTSVLETLANTVTEDGTDAAADRRGQIPASPSTNSGDTDASSWAAPTASEREAELEESD